MDSSEPRATGDLDRDDRRAVLRALRDELIDAIGIAKESQQRDSRSLAGWSKELRACLAEIEALPDPVKVTKLDDARAEYARLVAVADLPPSATGTG